jgi:hypothetical protein
VWGVGARRGEAVARARPRARWAKGRQVAETATGQITIVSLLLSRGDGGWGVVYGSWLPIESTCMVSFSHVPTSFEIIDSSAWAPNLPGHQTEAGPRPFALSV